MFSFKSIVLVSAVFAIGVECSLPVAAAPLVAAAQVGYAHAVPQNVPPYASQISVESKAINPIVAGPAVAAYAAPVGPLAAPIVARYAPTAVAAPLAATPYIAAASPVLPTPYAVASYAATPYAAAPYAATPYAAAPYAAASYANAPYAPAPYALPGPFGAPSAYAAPYSYAAPAPLLRTPFGVAPAFVR